MRLIFQVSAAHYSQMGLLALVEFSEALARENNKVHIICRRRPGEQREEILSKNLILHRISIYENSKFGKAKFAFEILKLIKQIINNTSLPCIAHIYFSPSIVILPFIAKFSKGLKNIKWLLDIRSVPLKSKSKFYAMYNTFYRFYHAIVFIDELVLKELNKPQKPQFVVPLGSNFSYFKPDPLQRVNIRKHLGLLDNDLCFIYIGELSFQRKTDVIIDAFKILYEKDKNKNCKLLLVGDGDALGYIRGKIKNTPLENNIIFTGLIPYHEVPKYLNAADVGLSYIPKTPEYNGQPPRKTVDYLASGLPVIATNTEGNKRFVKNNKNGLLVEDDPESLAEGMMKLLINNQLFSRMKQMARQSVSQYDFNHIVREKLIPIYDRLLKNEC